MDRARISPSILKVSLILLLAGGSLARPSAVRAAEASSANGTGLVEYRDVEHGFSFLYPASLIYTTWQPTLDLLTSASFHNRGADFHPGSPEIAVSVFDNPQRASLDDWVALHSNPELRHLPPALGGSAALFENARPPRHLWLNGQDAILLPQVSASVTAARLLVANGRTFISISLVDAGEGALKDAFATIVASLRRDTGASRMSVDEASLQSVGAAVHSLPSPSERADSSTPAAAAADATPYKLPWPIAASHEVTEGWGTGSHNNTQMHYAYDFDLVVGEEVRASREGTVTWTMDKWTACGGYDYRNQGNYVTVGRDDGTAELYLHLISVSVSVGDEVVQGTPLGLSGNTGWTDCFPHLHFQHQEQGNWITDSQPVYFDEYPGLQLKTKTPYISQNIAIGAHISGRTGVPGATLTTDTLPLKVKSDSLGNYSLGVPADWSGAITPARTGCAFTPPSRIYNDVTGDVAGEDYMADCTVTYRSVAAQDGWVLESSETSRVGGSLDSTAPAIYVGDDAANAQYRGILSFNTSSLPDAAAITSVTLWIRKAGLVGTNLFSTLGNILVDIRKGPFGGDPALQALDFQAWSSRNAVVALPNTPINGWYIQSLVDPDFVYIRKTGVTQFRLRFAKDDNNNLAADFLKIYSGDASIVSYRPRLIVTYRMP